VATGARLLKLSVSELASDTIDECERSRVRVWPSNLDSTTQGREVFDAVRLWGDTKRAKGTRLTAGAEGLHVNSGVFDPGLTEVGQARNGAIQAPRLYESEQRLTSSKSRGERLLFSIQSSLTRGLQGFDECRSL